MKHMLRRLAPVVLLAALLGWWGGTASAADAPSSIRIGYAISLNGPFAPGATLSTLPNYKLWVHDVNARGGIFVKQYDKRLPIEVIEYDDASSPETAIVLTEKLMSGDKVDFVLPPWGTGMNLAVAPVYKKYGYPQLAVTAVANGQPALVKNFDTLFFFLGSSAEAAGSLVSALGKLKLLGKINNKVAVFSVADQFGAELNSAAGPAFKVAGFNVVMNKSYPLGAQDLSNELKQAKASGADTFVAFSYPPDTFMITGTAQAVGYNPKVFYTAVGTAFPPYKANFGAKAEGVLGIGGWDSTTAAAKDYFKRHVEVTKQEPDRWASPVGYASLEVLEQAIESAGTLDRAKVLEALRTKKFKTVVGDFDLKSQIRGKQYWVGQWQKNEFIGLEPSDLHGAGSMVFPKPKW
jgi:branched-chain amino acid transport system substrate-binding protein